MLGLPFDHCIHLEACHQRTSIIEGLDYPPGLLCSQPFQDLN